MKIFNKSGSILHVGYTELYDFKYCVRVWEEMAGEEMVSCLQLFWIS